MTNIINWSFTQILCMMILTKNIKGNFQIDLKTHKDRWMNNIDKTIILKINITSRPKIWTLMRIDLIIPSKINLNFRLQMIFIYKASIIMLLIMIISESLLFANPTFI